VAQSFVPCASGWYGVTSAAVNATTGCAPCEWLRAHACDRR
jgi:hypothetical protein